MSSVNLKRQQKINAQMSEVMDDFDRFEFFFASNWKKIVIAAVVAVVAVTAIVAVKYVVSQNKLKAAQAYSKAATIAQLEAAIAEYGNTPATVYLQLAALYIDAKDYANARKQLLAAAEGDAAELRWRAQLNLGYLAELEGKLDEAAAVFADFARSCRDAGSAGYAAEAYTAAGRIYKLAGKKAEAKNILEAGRNFVQGVSMDERPALQGFAGMINSMLADSTLAAK